MSTCECPYLPEKYHTTHFGATDPATIQEYNPWCPEHGHLKEGPVPATTTIIT